MVTLTPVMEQLKTRAAKIFALMDMKDQSLNVFDLERPSPSRARRLYPRPEDGVTV